jgi:tol-pal system protein YbgF
MVFYITPETCKPLHQPHEGIAMNALTESLAHLRLVGLTTSLVFALFLASGCGGSEEMMEDEEWQEPAAEETPPVVTPSPAPDMMTAAQKTIDSLKAENVLLRSRITRAEQDNRSLAAKSAELEARLAEMRESMETRPIPTQTPAPPRGSMVGESEYERGLSFFKNRHYDEAVAVFMGLLNTGAPEGLESNCHYWIGEAYYGMRNYSEAIPHFQRVFDYSRTTKRDDAQLMLGNCYKAMGDRERARQEYQKLVDQYPASPFVDRAKGELARMK